MDQKLEPKSFGDLTYDAGDITYNFTPLIGLVVLYFILRIGNKNAI